MKATKSSMARYSTQELINYVEKTDKKFEAAPSFIKRTSYVKWNGNSAAICAEIQKRQLAGDGASFASKVKETK